MLLKKETGGCTIEHAGTVYTWVNDGDAIEVPDDFGAILLGIRGSGYTVVEPEPEPEPEPVKPAKKAAKVDPPADPAKTDSAGDETGSENPPAE